MPPNSAEYVNKNRKHLNMRNKLQYYNKTVQESYATIHAYEAEHGLDQAIDWLKLKAKQLKLDIYLRDFDLKNNLYK